jgi:hypothetical protein
VVKGRLIPPRGEENLTWTVFQVPGTQTTDKREQGWPLILIDGFAQIGAANNFEPHGYRDPVRDYMGNLSWNKGSHNLRFGTDINFQHINESQPQGSNSYTASQGGFQAPTLDAVAATGNDFAFGPGLAKEGRPPFLPLGVAISFFFVWPIGGIFEGRAAILAYFKDVLDRFDRRFASRELALLAGPKETADSVWIRGSATYRAAGVPEFVLELEETVTFDGDRIRRLEDRYEPARKLLQAGLGR